MLIYLHQEDPDPSNDKSLSSNCYLRSKIKTSPCFKETKETYRTARTANFDTRKFGVILALLTSYILCSTENEFDKFKSSLYASSEGKQEPKLVRKRTIDTFIVKDWLNFVNS